MTATAVQLANRFLRELGNQVCRLEEHIDSDGSRVWEIPASCNTRYLSHDYFRYIGKFPPQIPQKLILDYTRDGDLVLDPMCGGGTVLLESRLLGRNSTGFDINPVSLLVSRVVSHTICPKKLATGLEVFKDRAQGTVSLGSLFEAKKSEKSRKFVNVDEFFTDDVQRGLSALVGLAEEVEQSDIRDFITVAILAVLRKVSRANVKKMNVVVDPTKKASDLLPTLFAKLDSMENINHELCELMTDSTVRVVEQDAAVPFGDRQIGAQLAVVHPPYISNTAFSESTRLQLGLMGVQHRAIWKKELRVRGSYVHEPDGLRKYLVGWHRILANLFNALKPGGYCCAVIGDGKIDFVRIPMAPITAEFGRDIGFSVEWIGQHRLNNNTGWTLSHKMTEQHIIVLRKG